LIPVDGAAKPAFRWVASVKGVSDVAPQYGKSKPGVLWQYDIKRHMPTHTIRLHRVLRATPQKVYRAFLEADALAKWLAPNGFTGRVHHLEAKVGGTHKMSFTNFSTGHSHSFGGEYLELVPEKRIRYTDKFDDPHLPGEMQVTVTLKKVSVGTELNILQEGVPEVIPAEACYLGWQESLTLLAKLVEADIPG
jgi:uncharacterized protein YndB with AHSA1/START domain